MEYRGRPVRRAAVASRLLTHALARKGLLGRKGRYPPTAAKPAGARRVGSKTIVVKRKKQNIAPQRARSGLGGLPSFSTFRLANKPNLAIKTMKNVTEPNVLVENFAYQIKNAEGFQNALSLSFLDLTRLKAIANVVPGAGGSYPGAPKRYFLESVVGEYLMTNSSLATQYVDIYDIVRKRDVGSLQYTEDPVSCWSKGVSDQVITSPDATAWQNVMSLPTDSKLFCDYFRIVKRTKIGLVAGATHRHQVLLKPNKLVDTAMLNQVTGDPKGYTVYTMVVINGQPASIPQEGANPVVTTVTTALDVVLSQRIKYSFVYDNSRVWTIQDNLSSLTGEEITQPSLGKFVLNSIT